MYHDDHLDRSHLPSIVTQDVPSENQRYPYILVSYITCMFQARRGYCRPRVTLYDSYGYSQPGTRLVI